ncbi:MAG: hypothetical protein JWL90_793 [Chthoniobacteraceae bacterium]|nr:hypothetical protein [Chthoniobacteraceae bacterium]
MAIGLQNAFKDTSFPLVGYTDERMQSGIIEVHVSGKP